MKNQAILHKTGWIQSLKLHGAITLYMALIGYKRIMMVGIAMAPFGIWALGTGTTAGGWIRDQWVFDHQFLILFGGLFWCPLYIWFGTWLHLTLGRYVINNSKEDE